jgi:hypothetical protein
VTGRSRTQSRAGWAKAANARNTGMPKVRERRMNFGGGEKRIVKVAIHTVMWLTYGATSIRRMETLGADMFDRQSTAD